MMHATVATHVGHVRTENQDRVVVGRWVLGPDVHGAHTVAVPESWPMVAVLDGMGGHAGGSLAAACAADVVAAGTLPLDAAAATALVNAANDAVFSLMSTNPHWSAMGSTLAALVVLAGDAMVINVGDSRVYVEEDGYLTLVSVDDTVGGGRLTQSLGGLAEPCPLEVHISVLPAAGRRFVLASDGLFGGVDVESLERCLTDDDPDTVRRLVEVALAAGGVDNISVAVVRCATDEANPEDDHV
jgi:serine/threonine protein phosphatase PrpC